MPMLLKRQRVKLNYSSRFRHVQRQKLKNYKLSKNVLLPVQRSKLKMLRKPKQMQRRQPKQTPNAEQT
ncbi:hypothetical protein LTR94_014258 [Friedmanniomyces endolithicus]|nr:hypothetical protein LTR94_014258 [Friedmanniomyces endolithicus]